MATTLADQLNTDFEQRVRDLIAWTSANFNLPEAEVHAMAPDPDVRALFEDTMSVITIATAAVSVTRQTHQETGVTKMLEPVVYGCAVRLMDLERACNE